MRRQWCEQMSEKNPDFKCAAKLIGVDKAEAIYGVSRWTLRRWAYDGKISSTKLGKRLLIPVAELERLVEEGTRQALKGNSW